MAVPQISRPDSDIANSGNLWTVVPLWSKIDEVAPSDTDFITGAGISGKNSLCELGLTDVPTPSEDTGHIIRIRAKKVEIDGTATLRVRLLQGATIIKTFFPALTTSYVQYNSTLTESEAANITDYTDLRFEYNATFSGGITEKSVSISWAEFEVPSTVIDTYTLDTFLADIITKTYSLDMELGRFIFLRPDADITVDGWTTAPLWSKIDEEVPIDADEIGTSALSQTGIGSDISLSPSGDPNTSVGHVISIRAKNIILDGTANLRVRLKEGSETIVIKNFTLTSNWKTHFYELLTSEADSITDYTNLSYQFEGIFSGPGDNAVNISWAEFRLPVGTFITNYTMDTFLKSEGITKTYTLDTILGLGPASTVPIVPEAPPEMVSIEITAIDEDGNETIQFFSAKDYNPFGSTFGDETKVIDYDLTLESDKGRRLSVTLDDPKANLAEISNGYLIDIVLDNIDLGFRAYKFEFLDENGNLTDSNASSDTLAPGTGATILNSSSEFGKWSKCLRLDGTVNARLDGPDNVEFNMTNAILLAGWIRPKSSISAIKRLVWKLTGVPINGYTLYLEPTNKISFEVWNSGSSDSLSSSTDTIDINAWNYIICYWDGTDQKMWILDDKLQLKEKISETATIGTIGSSSGIAIDIGHNSGTENLLADIDEFIIAPLGTNTLPTNIETLIERKMLKSTKCPVRYLKRGVITSIKIKNSQMEIMAEDTNIPTDYPLYDIMFEGQFDAADEVAFSNKIYSDIDSIDVDSRINTQLVRSTGVDLNSSTDELVRPIVLKMPKVRFLKVAVSQPDVVDIWSTSGGTDFSQFHVKSTVTSNGKLLGVGVRINYNGVASGEQYTIALGKWDEDTATFTNIQEKIFISDGSTGWKWVYHNMEDEDFYFTSANRNILIGITAVVDEAWTSSTPLKWGIYTPLDSTNIGMTESSSASGFVSHEIKTPAHYILAEDDFDILIEGLDYDISDTFEAKIKENDKIDVPGNDTSPIPSLILPSGAVGGFFINSYFYSTSDKPLSAFITRIFDKIEVTPPEFQGRITTESIPFYLARGGKSMDHIRNIMNFSDSELVFFGGGSSMVRDTVRSGFIKNSSFERKGQAVTDARFWKTRVNGVASVSERNITEFQSGIASWRLDQDNTNGDYSEVYQDLADVYAGQHFELWIKKGTGSNPDALTIRLSAYGSFVGLQSIDISIGLTTEWTKTSFTLTQSMLTAIGEKSRMRMTVRSAGLGIGSANIIYIDDFSPINLYGFKDKTATAIGNLPIQIEGPHIIPEPTFEDTIRKGKKTISIIKSGASSTGFSSGKPVVAIATDKPSINLYGYRGDVKESKQKGDISEFYEEALTKLNVERERKLNIKLAGQWAFLSGETIAILYPDIGITEYLPFPINSISITPENTTLRSRIRVAELAKPGKEMAELLDSSREDVFEAPVRDSFAQLIFGFVTTQSTDYSKIELRRLGATTYREQTTDITTMSDGSVVAFWRPEKEFLLTGDITDFPYIADIHMVDGSDVTQESFTLNTGFRFRRIPNQWIILWLFLSDG